MRIRKWMVFLLALLFLISAALADTEGEIVPLIRDDADLLTDEEEARLYEDMLPLCEYGTPMFWSYEQSGTLQSQMQSFYHQQLGSGQSGTLLGINMAIRELGIYSDGSISGIVKNSDANTITDNVFRMARQGEFYSCASSAFSQILLLMRGEEIARPMKISSNIFLALVLALLIVYLYISRRYEKVSLSGKTIVSVPVTAVSAASFVAGIANITSRMTKREEMDQSGGSGGFGGGSSGGFGGGGGSFGSHGF